MAVIASNTASRWCCLHGWSHLALCGHSDHRGLVRLLLFLLSRGPSDAPSTKLADFPAITHSDHEDWQSTDSCSTFCQLKGGSFCPRGLDPFCQHDAGRRCPHVHSRQNGNLMGLRAVRQSPSGDKRDGMDNDDGIVVASFWEDNNQKAFDDWNPGKKAGIGQTVADFMQKHKAQIVCADPVDKDGPVDAGIITLENGNMSLRSLILSTARAWISAIKLNLNKRAPQASWWC